MNYHRTVRSMTTVRRDKLAGLAIGMAAASLLAGCAAFDPQAAAQTQAPNYYNAQYSSLTPEQKMRLEDHLANQSNQAWRTSAQVASGVGRLAGGTGILLFAVKR